jgi:hypothetical protein
VSDGEKLVAEQLVLLEPEGALKVRISQHRAEDFWRVDVEGRRSATVGGGDSFMMNLIQGAVSGEPVAWRHLAHWAARPCGPSFG